ncbi:MAG: gamma-glutamyltransferase [Acidobacteriota bacterium]
MRKTASTLAWLVLTFSLISHSSPARAGASKLPVRAPRGMVVSSHQMASRIGVKILKEGGNAVDAAIATGLALAVVLPSAGNIGGGGFMVVRPADGRVTAFDFREIAPAASHVGMFLDDRGDYARPLNHEGYLAVGVPGTIAGFFLAHERLGRLPMERLIEPAIELARDGVSVTWKLHNDMRRYTEEFLKYPATARIFLKNGKVPYQPGEIWKQPLLAATLERLRAKGRDGFYRGETARLIAKAMREHGGLITEEDLARYQAKERRPVEGTYRGYEIYSMPPPSSGGVALIEMLNILEGFNLRKTGFGSAQHLHLLAEAMRRAFADRARYLGDPDFNPDMPMNRLISKEHSRNLRRDISLNRASVSDPALFNAPVEPDETTHFSVIDSDGTAVVVTYTLEQGYGSKIVAGGTGFLLNNEMGDFNPQPGRTDSKGFIGTPPNLVAPGKRMLSSMTPTLVLNQGRPWLLIGSPGGRTIINTVLQVIVNVIDFQMDISEAIAAPRIHHQWLPDVLRIEKFGISEDTLRLLQMFGHRIEISDSSRSQGRAMGIMVDPETGQLQGAADPRAEDGAAVGY